jgi:hypothetical protein
VAEGTNERAVEAPLVTVDVKATEGPVADVPPVPVSVVRPPVPPPTVPVRTIPVADGTKDSAVEAPLVTVDVNATEGPVADVPPVPVSVVRPEPPGTTSKFQYPLVRV